MSPVVTPLAIPGPSHDVSMRRAPPSLALHGYALLVLTIIINKGTFEA